MTAHNIQEDDTMENVAIGMPRIYVALDHPQADNQSNMIEVEGMLNKKTISILVDSGASHNYIDLGLVERFHLERASMTIHGGFH